MILGVNHKMVDHATQRSKKLDLVIARPAEPTKIARKTFRSLVRDYEIDLLPAEVAGLEALPDLDVASVGAVLVALEAKAAMTAHIKALPRLYDELNSAHQAIHGASARALAIAYVQINAAHEFASPTDPLNLRTLDSLSEANLTVHDQPKAVQRVLDKVRELPRRSLQTDSGYDGIGVTVLDIKNVGERVKIVTDSPAPQPRDSFEYSQMITRMANEYDANFARI
ncbi:hypothetical protein ACWDN6_21810 [Streptomyces albogriseolus]